MSRHSRRHFPIPATLNVGLTAVQLLVSVGCLLIASLALAAGGAGGWGVALLAATVFSFVMQLGFSLIHEAEHDKLHPNPALNDALAWALSALFPGSYALLKAAHLSHHRRNRSDAELVDYVRPGESRLAKTAQFYALICGLIWVGVPLLSLVVAGVPTRLLKKRANEHPEGGVALYLQFVNEAGARDVRRDVLAALGLWAALATLLPLSGAALALCYGAFAFSWASQQYIYHVRAPRHLVEGAFDLKLWGPLQALYLNFNYHLTHHRAPKVPWIHLPAVAQAAPTQSYGATYLALWRPPEPVEQAHPPKFMHRGPLPQRVEPGRSQFDGAPPLVRAV